MGRPKTGVNKVCEVCGKTFYVRRSFADTARYCSSVCAGNGAKPRIEVTCEMCGATFAVKPYRAERAHFCSVSCSTRWNATHKEPTGGYQRGFPKSNRFRAGKSPRNPFTTDTVSGKNNAQWVEPITLVCEHCRKPYELKPWRAKRRKEHNFCSRECFEASGIFRGENSPSWVGGSKTYRGRGWRKARLLAVQRDGGTCQTCGKFIGESIPVHHIRPFRDFADAQSANALDNLICLCSSCHMKAEPPQASKRRVE